MDREVSRTLAELERKLHELERALSGAGEAQERHRPRPTAGAPDRAEQGGVRLVDEGAFQGSPGARQPPAEPTEPAWQPAGPPPRTGARRPPAEPTEPAWQPRSPAGPAAYRPDETIDLAELVRFRDRLEQTMRELIADYDRIISLRRAPAAPDREPR